MDDGDQTPAAAAPPHPQAAPPAPAKPPRKTAKRSPRKKRAPALTSEGTVKVAHGQVAIVRSHGGAVSWTPAAEAKGLVDAGQARRATPRDLQIAGVPATPPGF